MHRRPALTITLASLAVVAIALALVACAAGLPSGEPSITGTVRQLDPAPQGATILVIGSGAVDQASVRITKDTRIWVGSGGGTERGAVSDVVAGAAVKVWFTGPVAESYPVQATAGTVLVSR